MNYNNYHFKKLLLKPINNLIDEIIKVYNFYLQSKMIFIRKIVSTQLMIMSLELLMS